MAYTRNTDTPFAFEEVWRDQGSLGPRLAPTHNKRALQIGHDHMFWWDGYQVEMADLPIRGIVDEISNFYAWFLQATVRKDEPILYLAYPADGSSENDRILEYNLLENSFGVQRIDAHTLLATTGHVTTTTQNIDDLVGDDEDLASDIDISNVDIIRHPTYGAMVLIGGHTGKLFLLNYGTTDDGTAITSSVYMIPMNPFMREGRQCKIGKIRMLVSTDSRDSCTVNFYKNFNTTAWKQTTLAADGAGDKHWVTLHGDGEVMNVLQIAFSGDLPSIHAVEIEFARAGKLDAGGSETTTTIDHTSDSNSLWRFYQNSDGDLELQKKILGIWTKNAKWTDD